MVGLISKFRLKFSARGEGRNAHVRHQKRSAFLQTMEEYDVLLKSREYDAVVGKELSNDEINSFLRHQERVSCNAIGAFLEGIDASTKYDYDGLYVLNLRKATLIQTRAPSTEEPVGTEPQIARKKVPVTDAMLQEMRRQEYIR